ncbi:putative late blight resistance protein homolog R1A-3 [Primulina huaijiensis]|uniref:putative late blight resistance protein homolog R1A-3 n=1 Tax=Primulina huaijiensis TaxID=1492673 RepID=UPI003CC723DB
MFLEIILTGTICWAAGNDDSKSMLVKSTLILRNQRSEMAAYASLLSLGHTLDQLLLHPTRQRAVLDKAQIHSLLEKISFLQDFLEDFPLIRADEIQGLEEKIARSAHAAEDIIESRVVDQLLQNSEDERRSGIFGCLDFVKLCFKKMTLWRSSTLFSQDLQKIIEEIGSMKKDVTKIKKNGGIKIMEQPRKAATAGSFIRGASNSKNTMVGFDEDLIQIMEKLTGHNSNLRIISIVGMGGIGKTTLATNVYHDPYIVQHFHVHAWVTISQQYSLQEIILTLLKDIRVLTECRKEEGCEEITQPTDDELGERLYKSLSGIKYLIVMDDLWSIECWNDIKRFFPDNNNGSRVMITTRLTNVADDFRSCTPHQLHFLDEDQSWALFCDKVFGKESCPPEFKVVGKKFVRNCGALPLAIVAISGLLAKSSRTLEYWESVANDTYAALNMGANGHCFNILSLSYKHLPVHLKPCFLYMAIFPEDREIRISRLVKLWTSEGILKPIRSRSLEEIAEDNLKDLIERNLIMIHKYGSRNKIKTCIIHDLIRELCLREAQKEKFLRVNMMHSLNNHSGIIDNKRRLIIQRSSDKEEFRQQVFDTHSLTCGEFKSSASKLHRLLRALNMDDICSYEEILRVTITGPSSSLKAIKLPAEIWEMPQLRHLKWERGDFYLPDPPSINSKNGRRDFLVLKNLQTLSKMQNVRFTDEVVHRIPNIKKLGITYRRFPRGIGWNYYEVYNLARLRNLESLFLDGYNNLPQNLCFPQSLKKLTLKQCRVRWEDLTVVGSLPHLEVLNLMHLAVTGRKWNPVEGQFLELKSLRIYHTDLVEWMADNSHFPRLEKLRLWCLPHLKEIPYGIGEIHTLRSIWLLCCSDSAKSSAEKIKEEQQNLGNYDLRVRVR